jgi:FtsP/CotA-like multicopper oxidase with cupredoxin domain
VIVVVVGVIMVANDEFVGADGQRVGAGPFEGIFRLEELGVDFDGAIGDKFLVNGRVQPYFEVERRKYRFRLLDGGISRGYDFWLSNGMTFQYLANDGNMITKPLTMQHVKLGVAERGDIVVDFSQLPASTTALYSTTDSASWFAKVARLRGITPVIDAAPTAAVQPELAKIAFNANGNARLLFAGPVEAGQQRFLLVSLAGRAEQLALPAYEASAAWFDPP